MNISFDCSEVIAEVNQRCTLEGRQPTVEEYGFVIDCLRQANTQLLQMNERLSHDREISQKLFHTEHLEVENQKKIVKQLNTEISGLKDEFSNIEANLQDTLQTNDALTNEINKLRQEFTGLGEALNAPKILEEINASLLREQESWSCKEFEYKETIDSLTRNLEALNTVHSKAEEAWKNKKTKYEQTIASLKVDLELCQCKHLRLENPVQESWKKKNNAEFTDPRLTAQYEHHSSLTTDAANSDNHNQLLPVSSGSTLCSHITDQLTEARMSQWIMPKTNPSCKKLIGNSKVCYSAENVSVCVTCGVPRCDTHLNDAHDSSHTLYINVTTKEVWCSSCQSVLPFSNDIKQYDHTTGKIKKKRSSSTDKLRPDTVMKSKSGVTATNDSLYNFNLQQRLSSLWMTGIQSYDWYSAGRTYHSKSKGNHKLITTPPFKGLVSSGDTCFFNAAVQGLSRINQFSKLLTKLFQPGQCIKVQLNKQDFCAIVKIPAGDHGEVSKVFSRTTADIRSRPIYENGGHFDPSGLLAIIQARYTTSFRPQKQGDAHEVMRCILETVRIEEIEKVKRGIRKEYTGSEVGNIETIQSKEDRILFKAAIHRAQKVRTYIDQVVGGEMLSVVTCDNCKHRTEVTEPFLDISLPIPNEKTRSKSLSNSVMPPRKSQDHTLEHCLEDYTSEDTLDNHDTFICSSCSGKGDDPQLRRRAVKQLKIQTLPEVFIMHLKRFGNDQVVTKNSIHVKYPLIIDVAPYCAKQLLNTKRQSTRYSLFAVIQHNDTLNFGHYTAYIKMLGNQWYKADDSLVTEVQEREALTQEAYILFYQKM